MKSANFRLFRYALPFKRKFQNSQTNIETRKGFIIQVFSGCGAVGLGEIAPLPGLHKESLGGVEKQLRNLVLENWLADFFVFWRSTPTYSLTEWSDYLARKIDLLAGDQLFPSVRFGIEMALFQFIFQHLPETTEAEPRAKKGLPEVRFQTLVSGSSEEIRRQLTSIDEGAVHTIKLKIGVQEICEEVAKVKMIRDILGHDIALRLDANRAWSFAQAINFGGAVRDEAVSFVEEPLRDNDQLVRLYEKTGLRYARDESCLDFFSSNDKSVSGLAALIIKPSTIGGLSLLIDIVKWGSSLRIEPILSCEFLSGVGLAYLVELSLALLPRRSVTGLGTFTWFREDLIDVQAAATNGTFDVVRLREEAKKVNWPMLERVI